MKFLSFIMILLSLNYSDSIKVEKSKLYPFFQQNNDSLNGQWSYEFESEENQLLNRTFELDIIVNNNTVKGSYCGIAKGGNKIDCSDKKVFNITGKIKNNIAIVDFFGFYDNKSKGVAKIYLKGEKLVWEIINIEGETGAPKKVEMIKKVNTFKIEGVYTLKSCQNSRFKINILDNKKHGYSFKIYDNEKVISSGIPLIDFNKKTISFKDIRASFNSNSINVNNYDNKKIHFIQCEEKMLSFIKP